MGFFKIARSREEASNYPTQLVKSAVEIDAAERDPLSYIAGYIVSKMHQKSRKKKRTHAAKNYRHWCAQAKVQIALFLLVTEEAL